MAKYPPEGLGDQKCKGGKEVTAGYSEPMLVNVNVTNHGACPVVVTLEPNRARVQIDKGDPPVTLTGTRVKNVKIVCFSEDPNGK